MKFSLALVLVSLSVLTAAKHQFARRSSPNPGQQGGNGDHSGSSGTPANVGNPAKTQPATTPSGYVPKTGSTTGTSSSGWVQNPTGDASFSAGSGCQSPACGQKVNGYSAAVNELAFGSSSGPGGACGRCFKITPTSNPNAPSSTGPFGNAIVVKVNDLCSSASSNEFCGQTASNPVNNYGMAMHFELCTDSGAPGAFFPSGNTTMLGAYEEVSCSSNWSGSDGEKISDKACMTGESAGLWPNTGCSNSGTPPA